MKQRSVDKITGASPQSFFQPTPPDLPLTIGRVELRNGGSDPAKRLPLLVRAKIIEYAEERAAGTYGGTKTQNRRFSSKLQLNARDEWARKMAA